MGIITIFSFASIFFFFDILSGSAIAASSITLGITCEVLFLGICTYKDTKKYVLSYNEKTEHISQKSLLVFFIPLIIDAILPASTQSIINAAMGLKNQPEKVF